MAGLAVEILIDDPISSRGKRMLKAMAAAAPDAVVTESFRGGRPVLMLYGPGSDDRLSIARRHRRAGGRVVMWDMGYWDREHCMRLAVDLLHPTPAQIAASPATGRRTFELKTEADEAGPILLVGLGAKSSGCGPQAWERDKLAQLQHRFPGRSIVWRPKGRRPVGLEDLPMRTGMPIHEALRGISLVVCKHSNVAVDACVAGVPVECEAGAALALYASGAAPDETQRADFLARLSWWNWSPAEAPSAWDWISKVMACD